MMNGHEKSDSAIVAGKPTNKAERSGCGAGGAKGGGQGEREPAEHAPDTEPGKRGPGAGAHTASSKAKEEGEVHRALPPHQHRPCSSWRSLHLSENAAAWGGRADMAGLRGRPRAQSRGSARTGPSRSVSAAAVAAGLHTKAGWTAAPLAVAALEDKIVQRATAAVLNAIYEEDFLGFSYGFRPGRGAHDAMDALVVGIDQQEGELHTGRRHPRRSSTR